MRGRTTILISHRISTIRGADQIVVIEDGAIAERGTHEELMENGTYYPELFRKQLLEEELERALRGRSIWRIKIITKKRCWAKPTTMVNA